MPIRAPAARLLTQVNGLYADPGCCGDPDIHAVAGIVDPKERKLFEAFAAARHAAPNRPELATLQTKEWQDLYRHIAGSLLGGAEKGFGQKLTETTPGSADQLLLQKLSANLHFFSAHKNYHLLVDLNHQLLDAKGQLRPWGDFRKEALKLSSQYNVVWLRTEYNAAVGASQMAAKWTRITSRDTSDIYLRYDTAGDKRVRPAHMKLDGITLPVDDPFWDTYYPPSAWNCRCDVTEVLRSGAEKSDISDRPLPPVQPGFRTNVGKTGEVFSADHPYFKNTPPKEAAALDAIVGQDINEQRGLPAKVAKSIETKATNEEAKALKRLLRENRGLTADQAKGLLKELDKHVASVLADQKPFIMVGGKLTESEQYKVLRDILKDRFKTQFDYDVRRSGGLYDPGFRARAENHLFGHSLQLDPAKRPVYGYLAGVNAKGSANYLVPQYGSMVVRLKDSVLKRTTLTGGDSLQRQYRPSPSLAPRAISFIRPSDLMHITTRLEELRAAKTAGDLRDYYLETQYHDGLGPDDIEAISFEFLDQVPDDIRKACERRGIKMTGRLN